MRLGKRLQQTYRSQLYRRRRVLVTYSAYSCIPWRGPSSVVTALDLSLAPRQLIVIFVCSFFTALVTLSQCASSEVL